jgi:isocitrate dehydrogenase (NAD+)
MAEARIIVLEGDETGQELLEQAIRVLDPSVTQVDIELEHYDLSLENRRKTNNDVVHAAARAMKEAGFGIKAATITPEGKDDVGSPNRILREEIDGKVIIRTGRRIPGVTPIAGVHYPISVVRMAVGDAYGAKQWREDEDGDEIAYRTERISRSVCRAVAEYAFRTARKIHGRVYGGPKWTVSPVYEGMLKEELDAASERHPEVPYQPVLIDATYAGLVSGSADAPLVIPALNRDGDCLSDMVLPLFGSIAGAESVLLSFDDQYGLGAVMSEAPHGTAPALQGKNIANPMAMLMASAAILHYVGEAGHSAADLASRAIYESVLEATATGVRTPDLGGSATTSEFTDEVISRTRTKIDIWTSLGSTV